MYGVVALAVLKLTLRLELGPEYDSNANRAEIIAGAPQTDTPTGSFLLRSTARGTLAWRKGNNVLRAVAGLGGKVFFNPDVQDQDTLVGQLAVEDRVRARDWLELGGGAEYYDAGQLDVQPACASAPVPCGSRHRDFRTGTVTARVAFVDDEGDVALLGGYRGFEYKPDATFDFQAGTLHAAAAARLHAGPADHEAEIDLAAGYHFERRIYSGLLEQNSCPPGSPITDMCLVVGSGARADWFHEGSVELTFVRELLASVGYALQVNLSNSFGQSLVRHIVSAKISFRLPWQLYTTLKGQILVTRYLDPVLLDRAVNTQTFISIEDENRNAFVADIERPIGKLGLAVEARYSVYTNELTAQSPVSFLRHVVYLGVTYKVGR